MNIDALLDDVADRLWSRMEPRIAELLDGERKSEPLMNAMECARWLAISEPTLRKLRREGLPTLMVCESPRFDRESVLAFMCERSEQPEALAAK